MTKWCRLLAIMALAPAFWLCAPSLATAREAQPHCQSAGVAFGKVGRERVEDHDDHHGHEVELWCVRGVFSAHYDLRIGWNEQSGAGVVHRSRTIAGCFFNHGSNIGPALFLNPAGAYSRVEWTNESPSPRQVTYHFGYDYSTGMVTVTMETPCHAPIAKVLSPQESFEKLSDLLPDPPEGACPLKTPTNGAIGR